MFRRYVCCCNCFRRCEYENQKRENSRQIINTKEITYEELLKKVREGAVLIDVRTKQEFLENHLERAILIPYYEIARKIENIIPDKERNIILYCQNGGRSMRAYEILKKLGYSNLYNLKGGIEQI